MKFNDSFQVNVNSNFDFNISEEEINTLDIIDVSASQKHVITDNTSQNADISEADFQNKTYKVKVENRIYNVKIHSTLDQTIKNLGFEVGEGKKVDKITAPMPGLILEINIKSGDTVEENQPLLILEAMKMENIITSPRAGIIKSINIKIGDAVEKNQLLVDFES